MYFHRIYGFSVLTGFLCATTAFGMMFSRPVNRPSVLGDVSYEAVTVIPDDSHVEKETRTYENTVAEYSLEVPSSWTIDDLHKGRVTLQSPDGRITATIMTDAAGDIDLPSHSDELFTSLQKEQPSSQSSLETEGRVHVGSLAFARTPSVQFASYEKNPDRYSYATWVQHSGHDYVISVSSQTERSIENLQRSFTDVFSSFSFIDAQAGCPDGQLLFTSSRFSVCYPERLTPSGETDTQYIFSSDVEKLVIEPHFSASWPFHMCNFERAVTVDGHQSTRTIFRKDAAGGCGDIAGFGTLISTGSETPWYIGLYKESGAYGTEDEFAGIEQTLRISKDGL